MEQLEVVSRGKHIFDFSPQNNNVTFVIGGGTEILRLDEQGMVYKGQRIEDAGVAHKAFMEVIREIKEAKHGTS